MTRRCFLSQTGTWLLSAHAAQEAFSAEVPLARMAIVTDIHYADKDPAGTRQYRDSLGKLEEAVARWNADRVDAAIQLGDLVDASPTVERETADLRRAIGTLRQLRAPWHFALGNHCVSTLTKAQFLAEWGAESSFYSFSVKGYRCVVLDSAFTSDGQPYGGREFDWKDAYLPPQQIEWLRGEVVRAAEPVLVFLHHRLDSGEHHSVSNAPAVRAALEATGNVVAVFQGHQHINYHREIAGIHYCTLKAMVDGEPPESSAYGTLDLYAGGRLHLRGYRLLESRAL